MRVVFLKKLKPDGKGLCSQPGLKVSPAKFPEKPTTYQRWRFSSEVPHCWWANGEWVGISQSENKRKRKKKLLGPRALSNGVGVAGGVIS